MIQPVILSGGFGTRLWPVSRRLFPKQFHRFLGSHTLIQETVLLTSSLPQSKPPLIICNEDHRFSVLDQLGEAGIQPHAIFLEPAGRNTAPAIAAAAFFLLSHDPLMLVCPSDHLIKDQLGFTRSIEEAIPLAEQGKLVTFGVRPTFPSTEFGYIQANGNRILRFVEKPVQAEAEELLAQGDFLWNSGIFLFKASAYLKELKRFAKAIYDCAETAFSLGQIDLNFLRLEADSFKQCPSDSIDYAVMEKTDEGAIVPAHFEWSDIGSWPSIWEHAEKDAEGNASVGDVFAYRTEGCYLRSDKSLLVAVGVKDLVIVETDDALLVADRYHASLIKDAVRQLSEQKRCEVETCHRHYRPWGYFESLSVGDRYQVKKIAVKPGCKLSLQYHHHRAEHWVVVKGLARVTRGDRVYLVNENESTFIPLKEKHRLENAGTVTLEMIEIQSGSYLGEDDIVRLEDDYLRMERPLRETD
jgi:mannose-1-phosphate guanylyltransferase